MLTDAEREALNEIFFTDHSDWYTSMGHGILMTGGYRQYGWQVPEVHREHDKALMQMVGAEASGLPLAIFQAWRIIEREFDAGLSAA
jgi:hypothetical protein